MDRLRKTPLDERGWGEYTSRAHRVQQENSICGQRRNVAERSRESKPPGRVSRAQRSTSASLSAFTRVFDALWREVVRCRPGTAKSAVFRAVPDQRRSTRARRQAYAACARCSARSRQRRIRDTSHPPLLRRRRPCTIGGHRLSSNRVEPQGRRAMKAAFIQKFGGPEVLQYGDLPDPV